MEITLLLLAAIGTIIGWWLSKQRLMSKPWLEEGALGELPGSATPSLPTAKLGLGVFLAVASSLFALFISAYTIRMRLGDWRPLPTPGLLWLNTGLLVFSSIGLQWAQMAARRADAEGMRTGLLAGAVAALAFLVGQLLAWQQLTGAGYFLATNPANSFFYMLTAVHGLHLLGGLVALGRTSSKVWQGAAVEQVRLSVELCAIYRHFLLVVWLVLFGVLLLESNETLAAFLARCASIILGR